MNSKLQAINICKSFNKEKVLDNINFNVNEGEFLSILGPSGCGKTTLLRILIGIEKMDEGTIIKDGIDITNNLPSKRNMGIVFQDYALFPNMTVRDNIMYGLIQRKHDKAYVEKTVDDIIDKLHLNDHKEKGINQLSGGQKQRVAIARTLVLKPDIILFDEPMSSLDVNIRADLRNELKSMQKSLNLTIIYVTHDQEEAFSMSDRIMVMDKGIVVQIDTPKNIYNNPLNNYVKNFIVNPLNEKIKLLIESTGIKNEE